jgi:nucleoside-diphosphate-sugar epimerase
MKGQANRDKNPSSRKILIAGGAGFIGSHLCDESLRQGDEVFCLDNLLTGNKNNLKWAFKQKKFHFFKIDIIKPLPDKIKNQKFDAIFHLASPASPNPESPLSYLHHPLETLFANSLGTYHLLDLAKIHNSKFLFASTSEIYGEPQITPQNESYWGNVNPNGIRSCYDEAKRFGEAATATFIRKFNLDARIIRIFNTFGTRMDKNDGRVVVNFINQAIRGEPITVYGNGSQTRSFCYVDDTVKGIMAAMFKGKTKGIVINIGNPEEHTILELAKMIIDLTSSDSEIVFKPLPVDDPTNRCPDITLAKEILGWEPILPLKESLLKTIVYFYKPFIKKQ